MNNDTKMIKSHSLVFTDFDTAWYKHWARELKQNKDNLEGLKLRANKFWQNAVMAQVLYEREQVEASKQGIGFGVGRERLPAVFAKHGVKVTATDQDFRTEKAKHWEKHELATGAQSLNKLSICSPKLFAENVSYKALDMTNIPKSLFNSYDFVWSNCALGHLGSIEAGLKFITESARCLKPGGVAVHTTEINVINNLHTVDNNPQTVIFRPRDIRKLALRLLNAGYVLEPLELTFGSTPDDKRISISPEFGNDYSKLQVGGHLITQIVLVITKPTNKISPVQKQVLRAKYQITYRKNLQQQKGFIKNNPFLHEIAAYEKKSLGKGMIKPLKKNLSVSLKKKPEYIYLTYKNMTKYPIFGMHDRLHTTKPIALSTSGPDDHLSQFKADDWFNDQGNRPSIYLCTPGKNNKWEKLDYIRPKATFSYRVKLDPSKVKSGQYNENFHIVQEGKQQLTDTQVTVTVKVS